MSSSPIVNLRGSGGVVVKLLVCGARGPGSISGLAAMISEISYLLLPSHNMAEIPIKQRKYSTNQPTNGEFNCNPHSKNKCFNLCGARGIVMFYQHMLFKLNYFWSIDGSAF